MLFDDTPVRHQSAPQQKCCGALAFEYDDGNGLFITSYNMPCHQGFSCKYYPQD